MQTSFMPADQTPMLRAIKKYAEENGIECYISLEERLACGVVGCLPCLCVQVQRKRCTQQRTQ